MYAMPTKPAARHLMMMVMRCRFIAHASFIVDKCWRHRKTPVEGAAETWRGIYMRLVPDTKDLYKIYTFSVIPRNVSGFSCFRGSVCPFVVGVGHDILYIIALFANTSPYVCVCNILYPAHLHRDMQPASTTPPRTAPRLCTRKGR